MRHSGPPRAVCVDLFCGCGGLSFGLSLAGIHVVAGVDSDPDCRYAYEANNPGTSFVHARVEDLPASQVQQWLTSPAPRVLAGCAPCQPFSPYASRYDHSVRNKGGRWRLMEEFARLVKQTGPDLVVMENVSGLARSPAFVVFLQALQRSGYRVVHDVIDCAGHEVAQHRKRLVLLASRHSEPSLPEPGSDVATVSDAIGAMPPLEAGDTDPSDALHRAARLTPLNLQRIQASAPGGTWRQWPETLRADCHRRSTGLSYDSVYGRMRWDRPSPTLTTQYYGYGKGRFGHPDQDRAISLREGAILQGFPRGYEFMAPQHRTCFQTHARMIGNAVPPPLARQLGEALLAGV